MIAATPTGLRKVNSCLSDISRRHGLAVEPPALADEEVAGVDDLLHLAERLGVGLADLARDQARERLLVVLDEPAELLDRAAAHGRRHGGPLALGRARGLAGGDEGGGVAEQDVGDRLAGVGRVGGGVMAAGRVGCRAARDDRGDGAGHGAQPSVRRAEPSPGVGSRSAAQRPMRPLMRRLLVLPLLLAGLAARARGRPGRHARREHRRQRRRRRPEPGRHRRQVPSACSPCAASFPAAYADVRGHRHRPPRASGMGVVFVLVGNARRATRRPTRPTSPTPPRRFAAQMKSWAAPPPTRSGTRRTRPTSGARRSTRRATPRSSRPRIPASRQADPEREGPARTADRQQLQLPRARSTPPAPAARSMRPRSTPTRRAWSIRRARSIATAATSRASPSSASAPSTTSWSPTAMAPSRSG